jgi:DNA-binding NarL/FixJ family response regulator
MLRALFLVAGEAAANLARRRFVVARGADALTVRQRQVLAALARGRHTKEIARDLGVTEATVKTHLARACERLGAATRAEAVARYVAATKR